MKPNDVNSKNEQHLLDTVYNYHRLTSTKSTSSSSAIIDSAGGKQQKKLRRRNAIFKINDYVRLSKHKSVFEKGYTPNWTTEIFRVRKIQYHTDPITYLLSDYENRNVEGSVYAEEIQLVKYPNVYLIEKILRRNKKQVYVKWLGFGPEHNSWIFEKDIV